MSDTNDHSTVDKDQLDEMARIQTRDAVRSQARNTNGQELVRSPADAFREVTAARVKLNLELQLQRRQKAQELVKDPFKLAMKLVEVEERLDNISNPTKENQ